MEWIEDQLINIFLFVAALLVVLVSLIVSCIAIRIYICPHVYLWLGINQTVEEIDDGSMELARRSMARMDTNTDMERELQHSTEYGEEEEEEDSEDEERTNHPPPGMTDRAVDVFIDGMTTIVDGVTEVSRLDTFPLCNPMRAFS